MMETNQDTFNLALVDIAQVQGMERWTDDKRNDFALLFEGRAIAARYIFTKTADIMWEEALRRRFISEYHRERRVSAISYESFRVRTDGCTYRLPSHLGGRSIGDLDRISNERAAQILAELPPLKAAVRIISRDVAEKIDRRDALLVKLRELKVRLEEMAGSYRLADVDQKMTIGDFRQQVKAREKKRKILADRMNEMGIEGNELDQQINVALYRGLPGLSDAVIKVVNDHLERATALDTTARRVIEKVKFGDSEAALELLQGFERDEITVSDTIRQEFTVAMQKLRLTAAPRRKTGQPRSRR